MLDLPTLALFAIACLALTATPGPDMLLIASRSLSQGKASGFATLAGIQAGTYCHALAAAFGLSQLFLAVPLAYDSFVMRARPICSISPGRLSAHGTIIRASRRAAPSFDRAVFRQGLLTNLLNPKMALFVLALFPQFVRPDAGNVALQIMLLATVLNLIGLIVNGAVLLRRAARPRFLRTE